MLIGLARVSSREQNLDLQIDALKAAGCEIIIDEKAGGDSRKRPGLTDVMARIRKGDTLVIWKLDRLGRSTKELVIFVADLQKQGIEFRSLTEGIDTSTPAGRFFFHIMAALAQMELELIRERTRAGLDSARAKGLVGGRRKALDEEKIASARTLLESGTPPRQVAEHMGVSVATLYRYIPAAASIAPA